MEGSANGPGTEQGGTGLREQVPKGQLSCWAELWREARSGLPSPSRRRGSDLSALPSTSSSWRAPLTFLASNILFSKT